MTERVQIPAYTDRWMMGDCYGEVIRRRNRSGKPTEVQVKLDKSGKLVWVIDEDCKYV